MRSTYSACYITCETYGYNNAAWPTMTQDNVKSIKRVTKQIDFRHWTRKAQEKTGPTTMKKAQWLLPKGLGIGKTHVPTSHEKYSHLYTVFWHLFFISACGVLACFPFLQYPSSTFFSIQISSPRYCKDNCLWHSKSLINPLYPFVFLKWRVCVVLRSTCTGYQPIA